MIKIHSRLTLVLVVAAASTVALAQQGWSQIHVIKQGDKVSTLNSVYYDGDRVWLVGADGLILQSYDYGENFSPVDSRVIVGLNDVFSLKNRVWIVGDAGTMLLSTDSGDTFVKSLYTTYGKGKRPQPSGSTDNLDLYSVQFMDGERGYIVGDEGLILSSYDGGVTWQERTSGTKAQLFHLSFRGKRGWAVGTGGAIVHTDNGGMNWYPQSSGTTDDLNRVLMVSDEVCFASGDKGTLLRTTNGGATWVRVPLRTDKPLFGMSFIDKKTGWVVGYGGVIIRTYDGGQSWIEQDSQTSTDLFGVSFYKNRGFTIGRDGLVLRYFEKR